MNRCARVFCNKKGFTLTELTIVLVLLGLIALLATTVIISTNTAQNNVQLSSKQERDILCFEESLNDWLCAADNSHTTISVYENEILTDNGKRYAFSNSELELTTNNDVIYFSEITSITFDIPYSNVLMVSVRFRNSDTPFRTLHTITAAIIIEGENNE